MNSLLYNSLADDAFMRQIGVHLLRGVPYADKERNVVDIYRPYLCAAQPSTPTRVKKGDPNDWRNMAVADFMKYILRNRDTRESKIFFSMINLFALHSASLPHGAQLPQRRPSS